MTDEMKCVKKVYSRDWYSFKEAMKELGHDFWDGFVCYPEDDRNGRGDCFIASTILAMFLCIIIIFASAFCNIPAFNPFTLLILGIIPLNIFLEDFRWVYHYCKTRKEAEK